MLDRNPTVTGLSGGPQTCCPHLRQDQVDITLFDATGCGESVAWFHADANSQYVLGDMMAMEDQ